MISLLNCGFFSYPKDEDRVNQDSCLLPKPIGNGFVFAVADGVGSYLGAKEAANIATSFIGSSSAITLKDAQFCLESIKGKITEMAESRDDFSKAATTLSYCFIDDKNLYVGHVGDTRVYVKINNKLVLITKDHTQHQELLDDGIYTKRELKDMPGKNILTSALSRYITLRFQSLQIPLSEIVDEGGIINLYIMSDGAHHYWEKRPRFSPETLKKTTRFAASLSKRVESNEIIDDYTLVAASFSLAEGQVLNL